MLSCSSYKGNFGPVDDKPVKFRDGMPIDARRVPGKPLMVGTSANHMECSHTSPNPIKYSMHIRLSSSLLYALSMHARLMTFCMFRRQSRPTLCSLALTKSLQPTISPANFSKPTTHAYFLMPVSHWCMYIALSVCEHTACLILQL